MKQSVPLYLIELQHELLTSIAELTDPDEMLEQFLLCAIKHLHLQRAHFIQKENEHAEIEEMILSIPLLVEDLIVDQTLLNRLMKADLPDKSSFVEEYKSNNAYVFCFGIQDLGYVLFERSEKPFDEALKQALIAPLIRFYFAYLSRKQFLSNINQHDRIKNLSSVLKLDKRKFETILGAINDGVIALSSDKKIFFANQSAHQLLGTDHNKSLEYKYYDYFRLYAIDGITDITKELEALAINNEAWSSETPIVFKTPEHKNKICEINVQRIEDSRPNSNDEYYVVTIHDVTESHELEQKLAWQLTHDPLTRCLNRSGFENNLQRVVDRTDTNSHALICMDLDRFKHVNDIGGHMAGDSLLKHVAALIQQEIREADMLARIGGDEFCVIASNCDVKCAFELSERIRDQIERLRFGWEENVFSIGMSLGVSGIEPSDDDPDELFYRADEACMRSKQNGRNQVTIATRSSEEDNKTHTKHINYVNYVNKSLSAQDDDFNFVLFQQEIKSISSKDNKDHIEMLLRMEYDGDIIMPNSFLPTAERYGKIADIDIWVLKNSIKYINYNLDINVNVNLSGVTLSDDSARGKIYELISKHPVEAKNLCLEITETAAITNLTKCIEFMERISELGVDFALDDFGTGVSSFSYLKALPIKYLKIDGSFIRDICNNKIDQIVVKSINDAASAMSIQTVAEFVEDQAILDLVAELGIDYAQGYHVNRPQKVEYSNNIREKVSVS